MVVTDVGGLPEIVPDGRVGFVCRPDAAEVARAIDRIWRDDVLCGIPCEHGRGEEALFVGCDVRSHYGTLPIG
ncbi:MAG: glycosyltransferase [Alistipes putredinis]